jgi:ethanolamine utilization protein EutA
LLSRWSEQGNAPDEIEIFGFESFKLKSVGVTIGSSTTHLLFSELTVRRKDSRESKFVVSDREVVYRSPIYFTPYTDLKVDSQKLEKFFKEVYMDAGLTPDDVDTGAIIITGYAARKENAEAIVSMFSRWAGKFVTATAGPNLETIMAAHGSGAVSISKETGKRVMNVDIGGGTSKIAIIDNGYVIETCSIRVGARVVGFAESGVVSRIDDPAAMAAQKLGISLKFGEKLSPTDQEKIVECLTDSLFELMSRKEMSTFSMELMENPPLRYPGNIDILMFSGGVAEYIYDREKKEFGDLGRIFGAKIKERALKFPVRLEEPYEKIRATVMGAAQYSLQVSGNTIFISSKAKLPIRSLQVMKVLVNDEEPTSESIRSAVGKALERHDVTGPVNTSVALAIDLLPNTAPTAALMHNLSKGITSIWREIFGASNTLVLIFDLDIAKLVGHAFSEDLPVICVDGIEVGDLDYVDIGEQIAYSETVPVVLKNLVFFKDQD